MLWSGDPRTGGALVLARFPANQIEAALAIAASWARRYDEVALGEAGPAGTPPNVLALWSRGDRLAV